MRPQILPRSARDSLFSRSIDALFAMSLGSVVLSRALLIAVGGLTAAAVAIFLSPHRAGMSFSFAHLGFMAAVAAQVATVLRVIRLNEELVISEKFAAKGRVHSELAHEIGKPLGTLEVLACKLRDGSIARQDQADALASLARLAGRLREIVRCVLEQDPEPVGSDPGPRGSDPVQLADLIEKALHEIEEVRGSGRVVVHPLPEHSRLPAGSQRLGRVLVNLLDNAIEAVDDNQPVALQVRRTHEELQVEVRDNGVGIPSEGLQRVMDPFVTFRKGGSGLGLSISREIVEGLGGSLELESVAGCGTTARVRLQLDRFEAESAP
ncbi:MAG: GHKL domain-containing protein [Deltaproteobacteria bacterium]|nr:GHKL domain-containing protein [Deltaproteobacteria bacterium]